MATLANTNVTRNLSANNETPFGFGGGGMLIEFFRVASGGVSGDTTVLTPRDITSIKAVMSGNAGSNNASTSGTTNVTLTLAGSTNTVAAFDVWVIGNR